MGDSVLTTIRSRFRLFKQPHKIGNVIDFEDRPLLIIGIEQFEIWGDEISVWYTCQDLSKQDYVTHAKSYKRDYESQMMVEVESTIKFDKREQIAQLKLGRKVTIRGQYYKLVEYTEVSLKGTDLYLSIAATPIYPIDRKEAKAKLINEKRKKLQLELV